MTNKKKNNQLPNETIENDVVEVIDKTALIENIINQIIISFCRPRNDIFDFMWNVLLDTSVMSLGAKIKVIFAISTRINFKINQNTLHKIIEYRNAFAHHSSDAHPVLVVSRAGGFSSQYNHLLVLRGSGKVDTIKRHEAFKSFNSSYIIARDSLIALKKQIDETFIDNA